MGSLALAASVGSPPTAIGFAAAFGALAVLSFPALAEAISRRLAG